MRLLTALALTAATALLSACADGPRYIVDSRPPEAALRLPVATLELRELVLPGHASGAEVLLETADGGLVTLGGALWADDPVRAHTATLARLLDEGSTARVAAEPWPLDTPPQAAVAVRIDRMLARADGTFALQAQVAVTLRDGALRERLERVAVTTPLPSTDAAGVAAASGAALQLLAERVLALLAT